MASPISPWPWQPGLPPPLDVRDGVLAAWQESQLREHFIMQPGDARGLLAVGHARSLADAVGDLVKDPLGLGLLVFSERSLLKASFHGWSMTSWVGSSVNATVSFSIRATGQ